jgi:hypothetical protein
MSASGRQNKAVFSLIVGLSVMSASSTCLMDPAAAQARAEAISLAVPPAFQVPAGGDAAFPIQITPAAAIPRKAILLIRGLPTTISLSGGRLFESGIWGVAAVEADRLTISSAPAARGRSDLSVSLVTLEGALIAEAKSSLFIRDTSAPPQTSALDTNDRTLNTAAPATEIPPPPPQVSARKRLSPEQSQQLAVLVKKGDDQLRVGNISAARLLYRHAADSGSAEAAMALAATFDAEELKKLPIVGGVQPDEKQARQWYEKARELGSEEARRQLQRFGAR